MKKKSKEDKLQNDASNAGRHDGRQGTGNDGRDGNSSNVTTTGGGHLAQERDLRTQGGRVGKGAAGKGGQHPSALGGGGEESSILGLSETNKLVDDVLDTHHLGGGIDILRGHAQDPGNGVEAVSDEALDGDTSDTKEDKEPVDDIVGAGQEGDETDQDSRDDNAELHTKNGAVGEGVDKGIFGLGTLKGDVLAAGKRNLLLGVAHLGGDNGAGDGHNAAGDQVGRRGTEANETQIDRSRNGGESRSKNLVNLGVGGMLEVRTDQHSRLGHSNKGGSAGSNDLDTRDFEKVDDDSAHGTNGSLDDVVVVEDLDDGSKEDDGGQDTEQEGASIGFRHVASDDESDTGRREAQERGHETSNVGEDGATNVGADDKETQEVLETDASGDRGPVDSTTVAGCGIKTEDKEEQSAEGDDTLDTSAIVIILGDDSGQDHGDREDAVSDSLANAEGELANSAGAGVPGSLGGAGEGALGGVGRDQVKGGESIGDGQDRDGATLVQHNRDNQECFESREKGEDAWSGCGQYVREDWWEEEFPATIFFLSGT